MSGGGALRLRGGERRLVLVGRREGNIGRVDKLGEFAFFGM